MSETFTPPPMVHRLTDTVARLAAASVAPGTARKYTGHWKAFCDWCSENGYRPLDGEEVVALNVAHMVENGLSPATVSQRVSAIVEAYRAASCKLDRKGSTLGRVMEGMRRTCGTAPRRQAAPIRPADLRAMLATRQPDSTPMGARDRLVLLLGFGAFARRSEITGLNIGDVVESGSALLVTFRRSKTDQAGEGQTIAIHANPREPELCPRVALRKWMAHRVHGDDMEDPAGRANRPLVTSIRKWGYILGRRLPDDAVRLIIKESAEKIGLNPDIFSGHSLRVGGIISALENGADQLKVAKQARHAGPTMTHRYARQIEALANDASALALGVRNV